MYKTKLPKNTLNEENMMPNTLLFTYYRHSLLHAQISKKIHNLPWNKNIKKHKC